MSAGPAATAPPHAGHRARLRERLAREAQAVADYEVLELLLGYALTRRDTKPLAKELLRRFGSIRGAVDARPDELAQVPGFGPGLTAFWQVLREVLARRASSPLRQREVLATPEAVAHMARERLVASPHEESWVALVDAQNRLIAWERLSRGGVSAVPLQPRDVLEAALGRKASGIILVHNHPGGDAHPSQPDLALTQGLQHLAPQLGLRFLDHVIVTDGDCYSITQCKVL
ncbi:MAG: DNA repair protein RadC [Desulfovibrio sp.]|nr:DNA repair protein RadC [Desulfovibrio sp.]